MKPTTSSGIKTSRIIIMPINVIVRQVNKYEYDCVRFYCIGNSGDVALIRSHNCFPAGIKEIKRIHVRSPSI
jgi:hypothetical protein